MARGSQATRPARARGSQAPKDSVARGGALALGERWSAPSRFFFAHQNLTAALAFGLFVLIYLWPVLLGGKILSPIGLLYASSPWHELVPGDANSYYNPLLSDVPLADYPWRWLVRDLLHSGTFPAWNPYIFGGIPLYNNPQTGLFSVFSLPLWLLPLNYGIGVGAALKLWAGGFGTYLLVRQLRLRFLPGLLAGICFSFSALNIVWLTHETPTAVAVMLPWMLWLVERIFQGGRRGPVVGLAAVTAIALGGGHPGMQVHVLAATAVYAALRAAFLARGASWGERLRPLGLAAGGLALGTLLMAFMLVPEVLSSRDTVGTIARSHGRGTLPGTDMPLTVLRTVLFPDWWGDPSAVQGTTGPATELTPGLIVRINYNERTLYAGVVALLLALVALVAPGGWRRKGPFAILAFLGLAIPLHLPGLYQLVINLPAFELVQNQRLHFVWALGLAVLAAFGLQALLERPAGDRWRWAVGLGALLVGVIFWAGAGATGNDVSDTISHFLSGRDFESDGVLALTSVGWYLLLAAGVGLALLAAWRWPRYSVAIAGSIVLLAAFDMLHFAHGYQPMAPKAAIPPKTPAIDYLQQHRNDGRILGTGTALPNDWTLTYGLHDVRGYDPPQPTLRLYRLWQVAEPGQLNWMSFAMEGLGAQAIQVASVLGARYIVAEPGLILPDAGGALGRALTIVYDGADARVFENPRAVPRAMVAPAVRVVDGEDGARVAIADPSFDPRREVVVEQGGGAVPAGSHGSVSVAHETNSSVTLHASLDHRGLVVLNDNWSDGWTVQVDGEPRPALRVNDVMRGVVVGPGEHEVEWRYKVPGLRVGVVLSLLAFLALIGGVIAVGVATRRGRTRHSSTLGPTAG